MIRRVACFRIEGAGPLFGCPAHPHEIPVPSLAVFALSPPQLPVAGGPEFRGRSGHGRGFGGRRAPGACRRSLSSAEWDRREGTEVGAGQGRTAGTPLAAALP